MTTDDPGVYAGATRGNQLSHCRYGRTDLLLLHHFEELETAQVMCIVIETIYVGQRRANSIDVGLEPQFHHCLESIRLQDQIRAGINDRLRSCLEQQEINPSFFQRMSSCQSDWSSANNEDLEVAGTHGRRLSSDTIEMYMRDLQ